MSESKRFRRINASLGSSPSFGPIPVGQLFPIGISIGISYLLFEMFLGWGLTWVALSALWGASSWWILTGDKNWKLLDKFATVPQWTCKFRTYQRLLSGATYANKARSRKTRL